MRSWLMAGMLLLIAGTASSMEVGGVQLPDTITQKDGPMLQLNGGGLRSKLFFKIYAGGLYLQDGASDGEAIIEEDGPALVRLHFIYDGIDAEKMQETWREGFAQTAPDPGGELADRIADFVGLFNEEVREGDVYDFSYQPQFGLRVTHNAEELAVIAGLPFKQALFSIWLGPEPVDSALKQGMLGTKR